MTRVMPMARIITVEPFRKISIRLPCRLPSLFSMEKKPGIKIKSKRRMSDRATTGKKSRLSVTLLQVKDDLVDGLMIHSLQLRE
jgi:hypothetical protein